MPRFLTSLVDLVAPDFYDFLNNPEENRHPVCTPEEGLIALDQTLAL